MSTRDEILKKVGSAIGEGSTMTKRRKTVADRLSALSIGILPLKRLPKPKLVALFVQKAKAADATVVKCPAGKVNDEIAKFLRKHNLPSQVRTGSDKKLQTWMKSPPKTLDIAKGVVEETDLTSVSRATGGIAETGTLILLSGRENPTRNNFLPENHIVIVHERDIVLHQEDVWKRLRKAVGGGKLPRTINMTTGPSRSADIEQTLILGAHGPVRLHILVVRG